MTTRSSRKIIHKHAKRAEIQKVVDYNAGKNARFLITPKAFREAGEAYAVMNGMDRKMAAKRAGHTERVQEQNYTKFDAIRARESADKHRKL